MMDVKSCNKLVTRNLLRRIVFGTMDELLGLITQKADHSTLLQKFESLHGQLQVLFQPRKPRTS
jgi:hypothetical protein